MLDIHSHIPAYIQIKNHYAYLIQSKQLQEGSKLPTEQEIADEWKISKMTVRQGLKILISEGLLLTKRGVGIFVKRSQLELDTLCFSSFSSIKKSRITTEVLDFTKVPVSQIPILKAKILGDKFWYLERLRLLDEQPAMLEVSYMPVELFPYLTKEDMLLSKYSYITTTCGYTISHSSRIFHPLLTDQKISDVLSIPLHTSIIKTESYAYLQDGKFFEYAELYHHPEQCIIRGTLPYKN
ncbi:MAG: GntR family transcriptional regulator [Brevinema sp.]